MVDRFRFEHEGREVVGPVQGAGGMASRERVETALRQARRGRSHGLYEPKPGCVAVFPDYSAAGNGEPVIVQLDRFVGLEAAPSVTDGDVAEFREMASEAARNMATWMDTPRSRRAGGRR